MSPPSPSRPKPTRNSGIQGIRAGRVEIRPALSHLRVPNTGRITILEKSKRVLASLRRGGYRPALDGRFVNTGLPFLVRDCRWIRTSFVLANSLVLKLNFCMRRGVTGQGAALACSLTATPLSSFPPWDGGTPVWMTASPPRTGWQPTRAAVGLEGRSASLVLRAHPGASG